MKRIVVFSTLAWSQEGVPAGTEGVPPPLPGAGIRPPGPEMQGQPAVPPQPGMPFHQGGMNRPPFTPGELEPRFIDALAGGRFEEARQILDRATEMLAQEEKEAEPVLRKQLDFYQREMGRFEEDTRRMEPEARREEAGRLAQELRDLIRIRDENPDALPRVLEMRELERNSWKMGERIQQTDNDEEKTKLTDELHKTLDQLFDYRQEERRGEMERLRAELEKLEKSIETLDERREEAIEKKFLEMTGQGEELDW
jgi:hypothetical protein